MFRSAYQHGFFSIFFSIGGKPLDLWERTTHNGHIKRITDADIQSLALEIISANVSSTFIHCPAESAALHGPLASCSTTSGLDSRFGCMTSASLGVRLPFIVMIVKNLYKPFSIEIEIIDDKHLRRRFRASTFASDTRVKPFECSMPMRLDNGWNQVQFNLADFVRRAYGTNYLECCSVRIHANCRLRRIYFSDRVYSEDELPRDFRLYMPIAQSKRVKADMMQALANAAQQHQQQQGARDGSGQAAISPAVQLLRRLSGNKQLQQTAAAEKTNNKVDDEEAQKIVDDSIMTDSSRPASSSTTNVETRMSIKVM